MSTIPLTFKEGANNGGPPDLPGRCQNPRPKRATMKSRINSSARPPKPKRKTRRGEPAGLARVRLSSRWPSAGALLFTDRDHLTEAVKINHPEIL